MAARIEPYHDSAAARAELIPFLERSFREQGGCSPEQWTRRLAHWWDANPFASAEPCRGWVMRDGEAVVGYLGVIPTLYQTSDDAPMPALIATSWAIDETHRHAAVAMGMRYHRKGSEYLLIDTTPSPPVQAMLKRHGWTEERQVRRRIVLRALAARMLPGAAEIGAGLRIITDPVEVTAIGEGGNRGCVRKLITPDYLRWYAAAPMREHRFLGIADAEGVLSSYLMVMPQTLRGVPAWGIVDWFTTREDHGELHALVGALARHPDGWRGRWWPLLSLSSFPAADCWQGVPGALKRSAEVSHFHWAPPQVKEQPKRTVLAEGDWGL